MIIRKFCSLLHKCKLKGIRWNRKGSFYIGKNYSIIHPEKISLGNNFSAGDNFVLQAWCLYQGQKFNPLIEIGKNVSMMENCQISCCNKITIGDGCLFGANVFITDNFHGDNSREELDIPPINRPLSVKGEVHIGSNVWLGRNVCVMPGVTIGNGAVIGANAVVTHDVPACSIAAGVPAKVIKMIK